MSEQRNPTTSATEERDALRRRVAELEAAMAQFRSSQEALSDRQAGIRRVLEEAEAGYFALDGGYCFREVNHAWLRMFGYASAEEVRGQYLKQVLLEESYDEVRRLRQQVQEGVSIPTGELPIRRKDGSTGFVTFSIHAVMEGGQIVGVEGFTIDVTERKRAEAQVKRTTRALRALSQCNRALVRAEGEAELLAEVCRILVETAGYVAAGVAYPADDQPKRLVPVGQCGFALGFLEKLRVTWDESVWGHGVLGTAVRTGQTIVSADIATDPRLEPWRSELLGMGCVSCVGLPLISGDQRLGGVIIYALEPDAFDAAELELLADLVDNLAYGIRALRMRKTHEAAQQALAQSKERLESLVQARTAELAATNERLRAEIRERTRAEEAIRESQRRYWALFEESPVSLWEEDISAVRQYVQQLRREGVTDLREYLQTHPEAAYRCLSLIQVLDVNKATVALLEGKRKVEIFRQLSTIIPEQSLDVFRDGLLALVEGQGHFEAESVQQTLTGKPIHVAVNLIVVPDVEGQERVLVSILDITERKRAEMALQQEQRRLRQLLDVYEQHRKLIAYDIHDTVCQRLTGALMTLEGCTRKLQKECAEATREGFSRVLQLLQEGLQESRRLMSGLRPPILDESGLLDALEYLVCENQGIDGLEIVFCHDAHVYRLAPPLETAIFRIVQEGLTNVQRHSHSQVVRIALEQVQDRICVEIEDWGDGFDPEAVGSDRFGLEGMRERTQLFGGTLTIDSRPKQGTRIRVELPLLEGNLLHPEDEGRYV